MPIPQPNKDEAQDDYIPRCIAFVKGEDPKMDNAQAAAICFSTWKSSKKQGEKMAKDWRHLEFFVPINEFVKNENEFLIRGVAINETTTRNNVHYKAEELQLAAPSLRNKPILKDHNNSVDSIVGRTTDKVDYNLMSKRIEFEGRIQDAKMQEMINDGRITSVSVGAMVKDLTREEVEGKDSYMVAKGIDFVEISLVAVPADPNAGFERAIAESYKLKSEIEAAMLKCDSCNKEFASQAELDKHMAEVHPKKEAATSVVEKIKEEQKMAEENAVEAVKIQYSEKARILEEQNAALNKKLAEYAEKEMNVLRESYKQLALEKGVSMKEGYEKLSKETMEILIDTIKSIKVPAKTESTTKGEVVNAAKTEEQKVIMVIEKSDLGRGFAMYAENIADLNPRYKWR